MTSLLYLPQGLPPLNVQAHAHPVRTPSPPSQILYFNTPAPTNDVYTSRSHSPTSYTPLLRDQADALVALLLQNQQFVESRKGHIQKQFDSRKNGKADIVTEQDCLDFSGEKSPGFAEIVSRLGIFSKHPDKEPLVVYKKVPRTSMQQKRMLETDQEFLVYLFSRWINVDSESVKLIRAPKVGNEAFLGIEEFKVWTSVETINIHGSYCQNFVVESNFNRHLFHRELL